MNPVPNITGTPAQTVKVEVDYAVAKPDKRLEMAWHICRDLQDVFDKARTNGDLIELADVCIQHREEIEKIAIGGFDP